MSKAFFKVFFYALPIIVLGVLSPLLLSFTEVSELWGSFLKKVLPEAIMDTFILVLGVSALSLFLGLSAAWICARYQFLGRRFFSKALILPLAFPSYVLAFIYLGFFEHSGPFFTYLRQQGFSFYFSFQSFLGLVCVMSFSLFPYVYFLCKTPFETYGSRFLEVGEMLGFSEKKSFFRLVLPSHKPWILTGLLFIFLDTLSDFGAVSIFNYQSLSVVIYRTWHSFFSWKASAQLSFFLMLASLCVLFFHDRFLKKARFTNSLKTPVVHRKKLKFGSQVLASLFLSILLFLSFVFPLLQLIFWSQSVGFSMSGEAFVQSLFLAFVVSAIIIAFSLILSFKPKLFFQSQFFKIMFLGYGVPGTVLAVLVSQFCSQVSLTYLWPLLLGFVLRFFMVGVKPLEAGTRRLHPSLLQWALTSGFKPLDIFFRFKMPILKPAIFVGFCLTFIEVLKEMPMTLMMRPSGWHPLSVRVFELTSEGEWERAAPFSLWIVVLAFLVIRNLKKV